LPFFLVGCGGTAAQRPDHGGIEAGTVPSSDANSGRPNDSALDGDDIDKTIHPTVPDRVSFPICDDGGRTPVSQVDLLFMIDNSSSMADKQEVLALAVPDLVNHLVAPACVDPATMQEVGRASETGACEIGYPDFLPVHDIHIGIISSSLGAHGAQACKDTDDTAQGRLDPHNDDRGHLVTRGATGIARGFLAFTGGDPAAITTTFNSMVSGMGQHGCGYEAQLESIHRF
jgi:hypothetical protein